LDIKETLNTLKLSDAELVKNCKIDNYQASGPGGQKRNRKLSAVRLLHLKSEISVTAAEYREGKRNLSAALLKLRLEIALSADYTDENDLNLLKAISLKLEMNENKPDFSILILKVFTVYKNHQGILKDTANELGLTNAKLVKFLKKNKQVWQRVQQIRKEYGYPPL